MSSPVIVEYKDMNVGDLLEVVWLSTNAWGLGLEVGDTVKITELSSWSETISYERVKDKNGNPAKNSVEKSTKSINISLGRHGKVTKYTCDCDSHNLFIMGCKCGAFKTEESNNRKKNR